MIFYVRIFKASYTPQLFFTPTDSENMYGYATKSNPLSLAINIAFQNGAPRVLGLNVQPDSATPASTKILLSSLPGSAFGPAPTGTLDTVTNQTFINGAIAGTFYIQDFNPLFQTLY